MDDKWDARFGSSELEGEDTGFWRWCEGIDVRSPEDFPLKDVVDDRIRLEYGHDR